ncbi:hypothetical protein HPB47_006000 [Ixodes persulcatus]|uniref:Uncharacterized protein n=1 Tax=Ixodes persulcatus TaxID=34615 RepID=A0AC60PBH8_IXOPE|nr:hypothetical protein HPB47_006000 [Ixodes persulcatus]
MKAQNCLLQKWQSLLQNPLFPATRAASNHHLSVPPLSFVKVADCLAGTARRPVFWGLRLGVLPISTDTVLQGGTGLASARDLALALYEFDLLELCAGFPSQKEDPGVPSECAFVDARGVWRHHRRTLVARIGDQCIPCNALSNTLSSHADEPQQTEEDTTGSVTVVLSPTIKALVKSPEESPDS